MILDRLLRFSNAQAVTAVATTPSTDVVDLQNARDMGIGDAPALKLSVSVGTTFASTGAATLQVLLQGSVDNSNWTTMADSPVFALATLVAGTRLLDIDMPRPVPGQALPRYLRLAYVVGTEVMSAGTINGMLVLDRQDYVNYPAGLIVAN